MKNSFKILVLLLITSFLSFGTAIAEQKWKFIRKVDVGTGYRLEYLGSNVKKYDGRVYFDVLWVLKGKSYKELAKRYGEWDYFSYSGQYKGRGTSSSLKEKVKKYKRVIDCKKKTIGTIQETLYDKDFKFVKSIDTLKKHGYHPTKMTKMSEIQETIYNRYCR